MKVTLYAMAVETFVPTLRTLSELLDKGAQHARAKKMDPATLVNARLAPDMYPLAKQVQIACDQAKDTTARLIGQEPKPSAEAEATLEELKARIARTITDLEGVQESAFEGAVDREIRVPLPNDAAIVMNGFQFLRDWALPHFYFHIVTAYDILRHSGVELGKRDYLSRVAVYIRTA